MIDRTDYSLLTCLDEFGACWKKRMHDWMHDHLGELPATEAKSPQTIGRRVDALRDKGLVETCIISPDAVDRDMLIGYKLTDAGEEAMAAARQRFLKEKVLRAGEAFLEHHDEQDEFDISRAALLRLMIDEFDIAEEDRELLKQCHTDELITVLMNHYFRTEASPSLEPDAEDRITDLITNTPALLEPYTRETLVERIRAHLHPDGHDLTSADPRERAAA